MMLITCPVCGAVADETDFAYGHEAHVKRAHGADAGEGEFASYLFDRANPKGVIHERWRHIFGCGKWFHMARNTATLEVYGTYGIREPAPPAELSDRIPAYQPKP